MVDEEKFKSKLKDKIEFAKKVSKGEEFEKEIFTSVLTAEIIKGESKISPQIQPRQIQKELSLKEFLLDKKPGNEINKTMAIGYFLEKNRNYKSFTKKDIEDGYREAKEYLPKNVSDTIQQNIGKGMMMPTKSKKDGKYAWEITTRGEKFVENNFKEVRQ